MKTRVQSLASLSGLRIWRCLELWSRSQTQLGSQVTVAVAQASSYSSNSTPSLGTSICWRCGPKETKKKTFKSNHNLSCNKMNYTVKLGALHHKTFQNRLNVYFLWPAPYQEATSLPPATQRPRSLKNHPEELNQVKLLVVLLCPRNLVLASGTQTPVSIDEVVVLLLGPQKQAGILLFILSTISETGVWPRNPSLYR